jgi:hypothetical protein
MDACSIRQAVAVKGAVCGRTWALSYGWHVQSTNHKQQQQQLQQQQQQQQQQAYWDSGMGICSIRQEAATTGSSCGRTWALSHGLHVQSANLGGGAAAAAAADPGLTSCLGVRVGSSLYRRGQVKPVVRLWALRGQTRLKCVSMAMSHLDMLLLSDATHLHRCLSDCAFSTSTHCRSSTLVSSKS